MLEVIIHYKNCSVKRVCKINKKNNGVSNMVVIGKRIRQLRTSRGMTQKQLADILGICEVSFQRYEYGTARPILDKLIALADYFDVSLDFLVGRTEKQEVNR